MTILKIPKLEASAHYQLLVKNKTLCMQLPNAYLDQVYCVLENKGVYELYCIHLNECGKWKVALEQRGDLFELLAHSLKLLNQKD